MTRKSRINYIHALSNQVERKKMYKAKKQWVVAGISFLVATGLGAIGSHLTTHADTTTTSTPKTTATVQKQNKVGLTTQSSANNKNISSQADALHSKIVNNQVMYQHNNSSNSAFSVKNNVNSNSTANVSSASAKSNISNQNNSRVVMTTPETEVGTNNNSVSNSRLNNNSQSSSNSLSVSNALKDNVSSVSANNGKVSNNNQIHENKPLIKLADNKLLKDSNNIQTGTWGSTNWKFDSSDGNLYLSGGQTTGFRSDAKNLPWNDVKHIYTSDVKAAPNMSFGQIGPFTRLPNVQSINLSGFDATPCFQMANEFQSDKKLSNIIFNPTFKTGFISMLASDNLQSIDLSSFKTLFGWTLYNNNNLKTIILGPSTTASKYSFPTGSWINLQSDIPKSLTSAQLGDGQTHQGVWTRNAEVVNYVMNNNTVASEVLHEPMNTKISVSDAPLNIPRKYNPDNSNQSFTVNGNTITVPVHLASQDSNSVANSIANSASAEASKVASASASSAERAASSSAQNMIISLSNSASKSASSAESQAEQNADNYAKSSIASASSSASSSVSSLANSLSASLSAASSALGWINENGANILSATKSASSASADASNAMSSLNNDKNELNWLVNGFGSISSETSQANSNANWIAKNSASVSGISGEISSINTQISKDNSALQKDIDSKANSTDLTNDIDKLDTDIGTVSNLVSSASSLAESDNTNITKNTTSLNNVISGLKTSANTDFTSAKNSLEGLSDLANGNATSLSDTINSLDGRFTDDENRLVSDENNIGNNQSDINDINNNVQNVQSDINNIKSDVANLKANTAITITFMKDGSQFHSPITLTNGYIEQNGSAEAGTQSGKAGSYDISSLLNVSAPNGYHVNGTYIVDTSKKGNGIAQMTLSQQNNTTGVLETVAPLVMLGANSSTQANNNGVNVIGNQAEYKGNIILNFGDHTVTVPYNTGVNNSKALTGDTINLLNYANDKNDNANKPSDYLSKNLIKNFDTTGFSFAQNGSGDYSFTIQPSDATNQNGTDVHTGNITLNFSANTVTTNIHYMYDNHQEGSDTTTGNDDAQTKWNSNNAKGIKAGWQLANSNNTITITKNGIVNINVTPIQRTDTINYVDQDGKQVGTQQFTGNDYQATDAGDNSIDLTKSNTNLNKGYIINSNQNTTFNYDGQNHTIKVTGVEHKAKHSITPSSKPSDKNNNKSNQNGTKPSNSDIAETFTIHVNDYKADGKTLIGSYTKYATENGKVGDSFTIDPSNYQTYGFNIGNNTGKEITGTIDDNSLEPNSITFNYYAKPYDPSKPINPNDPASPKPITVDYYGEKNGQANQLIASGQITGATGDTGNVESKVAVPQGYKANNNPSYTITTNEQTVKINLTSLTPSQINNKKNGGHSYKPKTPNNKPSDNKPNNNDINNNTQHGYATITIIANDPQGKKVSYQIVDESNKNVGSDYTINPSSFVPANYKVDSNDKALTGTIKSDGSLSNGSATFIYDVDASKIAPITITYYNQNNQLVNASTGALTSNPSEATQKINANQLAKSGAVGDYVDITGLLNAPTGYHFDNQADATANNGSVKLFSYRLAQKQGMVSAINPSGAIRLFMTMPANNAPQPNSNSASASNSAKFASEAASLASEIGADIHVSANTNDDSALNNLAVEIGQNNQEINSLANKPSSASNITYNNYNSSSNDLDSLVNSGISKLNNDINTDFKANFHHAKASATKLPKMRPIKTNIRWININRRVALHARANSVNSKHNVVKVLKPHHKITLDVKAEFKVHNKPVFEVRFNHHNYFITASSRYVRNAYLPNNKKLVGKRIRTLRHVYAYSHKNKGKTVTLQKGFTSRIKRIVKLGKHNMTRIQLANGYWISANNDYVEVL